MGSLLSLLTAGIESAICLYSKGDPVPSVRYIS